MPNPIKRLFRLLRVKVPEEEPDPEVVAQQEKLRVLRQTHDSTMEQESAVYDEVMALMAEGEPSNG